MAEMGDQLDNDVEKTISTKCIHGHKFKAPREKIMTSATGKSFIALCPKCNGVARLRREDVIKLFEINPRDHVAVGKLYADLASGGTPDPGETTSAPPVVAVKSPSVVTSVDDDEAPEGAAEEMDEEEDDEEDDDDDEEYTATIETVPDVTGKNKTVHRFRVEPDEDEDEEDGEGGDEDDGEEYERSKTPIKRQSRKPVKKVRRYSEDEEEDMEEEEEERQPRRTRKKKPSQTYVEDAEFDPNEVLMELIEESGLDDATVDRIADYVYMQPEGWQPAAIKGVLELYLSPASANKIALRYSAEISKEERKRDRERVMMGIVGSPPGNMRLFNQSPGMNTPPLNSSLQQGFTPPAPVYMQPAPQVQQQYQPQPPQFPQDPYNGVGVGSALRQTFERPAPRGVSAYEVERMVESKLDEKFKELTRVIAESKREEAAMTEAREMRNLVFELLKGKSEPSSLSPPQNPQVTELMKSQSDLVGKLLSHTLDKKATSPTDDPLVKMIIQELLSKKPTSAPPLANTSEELSQRIQLQRLANDLELAQADFRDKQEGRAFTRDLASQALSKIGEAAASAYIETQRIQAEAAKSIAAQDRLAKMQAPKDATKPVSPSPVVQTTQTPSGQSATSTPVNPTVATPQMQETKPEPQNPPVADQTHHVKGVSDDAGNIHMACPTCGSDMVAKVGDVQVICPVCNTSYDASVPKPQPRKVETKKSDESKVEEPKTPAPMKVREAVDNLGRPEHRKAKQAPITVMPAAKGIL